MLCFILKQVLVNDMEVFTKDLVFKSRWEKDCSCLAQKGLVQFHEYMKFVNH